MHKVTSGIKQFFIITGLVLLSSCSLSNKAKAKIVANVDYSVLPTTHLTSNPNKIEVLEFFWFQCPHCYQLEPYLISFMKKQASDVVIKRIHVGWGSSTKEFEKLAATMVSTKTEEKLHLPAYQAIFEKNIDLSNPKALKDWLKTQKGIDVNKFMDIYNSFAINTEIARYAKTTKDYSIESTPVIIVNGKYKVKTAEPEKMLQVTSELISKARSDMNLNKTKHDNKLKKDAPIKH